MQVWHTTPCRLPVCLVSHAISSDHSMAQCTDSRSLPVVHTTHTVSPSTYFYKGAGDFSGRSLIKSKASTDHCLNSSLGNIAIWLNIGSFSIGSIAAATYVSSTKPRVVAYHGQLNFEVAHYDLYSQRRCSSELHDSHIQCLGLRLMHICRDKLTSTCQVLVA